VSPTSQTSDALRRAATAVRNLIDTDPKRNEWAEWVPTFLDGMANNRDKALAASPEVES